MKPQGAVVSVSPLEFDIRYDTRSVQNSGVGLTERPPGSIPINPIKAPNPQPGYGPNGYTGIQQHTVIDPNWLKIGKFGPRK